MKWQLGSWLWSHRLYPSQCSTSMLSMQRHGGRKSDESYLVELLHSLMLDVEDACDVDLSRDRLEISRRFASEGFSFLSRTLPAFGKHFLRSLETGTFQPISGFRRQRKGPLPQFLKGLVMGVFEKDGSLLPDPSPLFVKAVYQICGLLYKVERPYEHWQEAAVLNNFVEVDAELWDSIPKLDDRTEKVIDNAILISRAVFHWFNPRLISPRHGPGAVAEKERDYDKFRFAMDERICKYYRYTDYFTFQCASRPDFSPVPYVQINPEAVTNKFGESRASARVCLVPKDSRGPRLIHIESKERQWIQQGLGRAMMAWLESHELTKGHVNFADQEINRMLALRSSKSGAFATLDLKDASDRVSMAVVRLLLPTRLVRALEACRAPSTVLPDGVEVQLKKFAGMGSAVCFPVESAIFYIISLSAICAANGQSPYQNRQHVYVYGDDIIVRTEYAQLVAETLEVLQLRVNREKSYMCGQFRESCGMDAFNGVPVTPIRVRRMPPSSTVDVRGALSWLAQGNLLAKEGFLRSAHYSWAVAEKVLPRLPYGSEKSGFICKVLDGKTFLDAKVKQRFNPALHRSESRLRVLRPKRVKAWPIGDVGFLHWSSLAEYRKEPSERDLTDLISHEADNLVVKFAWVHT